MSLNYLDKKTLLMAFVFCGALAACGGNSSESSNRSVNDANDTPVLDGSNSGGNDSTDEETGGDQTGGDETGGDETGGGDTGGGETGGGETGGSETGGGETGGGETGGGETGGGETGGDTVEPAEPVALTVDNVFGSPSNGFVDLAANLDIPNSLPNVTVTNSPNIIISADAVTDLTFTAGNASIPAGKKLAGYLVELIPNLFAFLPFNSADGTVLTFKGWSYAEYFLNKSFTETAFFTVYPIAATAAATITDIESLDFETESNWLGKQTLDLTAVATLTADVRVALTWDADQNLQLFVESPSNSEIVSENQPFGGELSGDSSLGVFDRSSSTFGPETIAYDYKMPEGEFDVYVRFDPSVGSKEDANYVLTTIINGESTVTRGELLASDPGTELKISSFTVDAALNETLASPIDSSQQVGVWGWVAEGDDEASGLVEIKDDGTSMRHKLNGTVTSATTCESILVGQNAKLPTGFIFENNELLVVNAFFQEDDANRDYGYTSLTQATLPSVCQSRE